jgi:D-tyrosyl-tRNA(Tyr) deacylase
VQRVSWASVAVAGEVTGKIGPGLVVFLGVADRDSENDAEYLARKIFNLRIFADEADKMNLSLGETGGAVLVVSQFTLYGDCRKGRRPSYNGAASPAKAESLYEYFISALRLLGAPISTGRFQAMMEVSLLNDGPVTILLDSEKNF